MRQHILRDNCFLAQNWSMKKTDGEDYSNQKEWAKQMHKRKTGCGFLSQEKNSSYQF